ncbi:MAG: hypothetical protein HS105_09505 [Chloracidobacterium sp.]|nr:hypothetical protein [Chloracidobacterium sp.]MCC6826158.1 hypothetical protein [Acidobacteriota bacterium]MCO5333277.1 hypothetical protein [Pyrinomonadaceae bacterium]
MKKTLASLVLAMVLMVGTSFAGDGIIIAGFNDSTPNAPAPCTSSTSKDLTGIIIAGFGDGIIIAGFNDGIIIAGIAEMIEKATTPVVNCGFSID